MDYEKAFHAQTAIVNAVSTAYRTNYHVTDDVLQLLCEKMCGVLEAHNVIAIRSGFDESEAVNIVASANPTDDRIQNAWNIILKHYMGHSFSYGDVHVYVYNVYTILVIIADHPISSITDNWIQNIIFITTKLRWPPSIIAFHHELRNLTTPIRGYIDLVMALGELSEGQLQFLKEIKERSTSTRTK